MSSAAIADEAAPFTVNNKLDIGTVMTTPATKNGLAFNKSPTLNACEHRVSTHRITAPKAMQPKNTPRDPKLI